MKTLLDSVSPAHYPPNYFHFVQWHHCSPNGQHARELEKLESTVGPAAEKQFIVIFYRLRIYEPCELNMAWGLYGRFYIRAAHIVERESARRGFLTFLPFCSPTFFPHWPVWSRGAAHRTPVDLALCHATEALKEKRFNTINHRGRFSSRRQIE